MDLTVDNQRISPFNNGVEAGLRILCILNESYPLAIDLLKLVHLDYITVHSGDFDESVESLHAAVPYRAGEMLVRNSVIEIGIKLFVSRGFIKVVYDKDGIKYRASDYSAPFLESLEEEYLIQLLQKAKWVGENFSGLSIEEIKNILHIKMKTVQSEFNIELLQ